MASSLCSAAAATAATATAFGNAVGSRSLGYIAVKYMVVAAMPLKSRGRRVGRSPGACESAESAASALHPESVERATASPMNVALKYEIIVERANAS